MVRCGYSRPTEELGPRVSPALLRCPKCGGDIKVNEKQRLGFFGKLFGRKAKPPPTAEQQSRPSTTIVESQQAHLSKGGFPQEKLSDALLKLGESKIESGEVASALTFFRQMLKEAQSEGVGNQMRNRLFNLSVAIHNGARSKNSQIGGNKFYFSGGLAELDAVISIMGMLLEHEPKAADLSKGLGLAYDNRGYCDKAERCYRGAITLDPNGIIAGDAWMNIGVLYMNYAKTVKAEGRDGRDLEIPLAGLRKEQLFPTEKSIIAINVNQESPHWKTAESAFEHALSIFAKSANENHQYQSDLVKVHWNLAEPYTDLLQGSKAIPHFQSIHRLDPNNQKAIDWLKDAERTTGKKLLSPDNVKEQHVQTSEKQAEQQTNVKEKTPTPVRPRPTWCPKCRNDARIAVMTAVQSKRWDAGLCPRCEGKLIYPSQA